MALGNNIVPDQVRNLAARHYTILNQTILKLDKFIIEG